MNAIVPLCRSTLVILLISMSIHVFAQKNNIDSFKQVLHRESIDSNRLKIMNRIVWNYMWTNTDSAIHYANLGLGLSKKTKNIRYESINLQNISQALALLGNNQMAIKFAQKGLRIAEKLNDPELIAKCNNALGSIYNELKDYRESNRYNYKNKEIAVSQNNKRSLVAENINLGMNFLKLNQIDSALFFSQEAYKLGLEYGEWDNDMIGSILIRLGAIEGKMGNNEIGLAYLKKAIESSLKYEDWLDYYEANLYIGDIYKKMNQRDSCLKYYHLAFNGAQKFKYIRGMLDASEVLTEFYRGNNKDSTLHYLELESAMKDSLFNENKLRAIQNMIFNENEYQKEKEEEKVTALKERKDSLQLLGISIFIITLFCFLMLLARAKTNSKTIKYLGLISLLLLFEFIGLLLHPIIGNITHHSPILMLLIMVGIAAILVPVHHRLEHWITHKLSVPHQKAIRINTDAENHQSEKIIE